MKAAVFSFTGRGKCLAQKIAPLFEEAECYSDYGDKSLKSLVAEVFFRCDALIFVGAAGIALRAVAPMVTTKDKDPAVLVADEGGRFVIPILSGHIGGGNRLARALVAALGATAVITTATDVQGVFAVDTWAVAAGLHIHNVDGIKQVSAALLRGEKIGFYSEYPLDGPLPDFFTADRAAVGIAIEGNVKRCCFTHTLHLLPKNLCLGVGCRKGIDPQVFEHTLLELLEENRISICKAESLATVDIKRNEKAILDFCRRYRLNMQLYAPESLAALPGEYTGSDFVKSTVGVDNVCERSAVLGANQGALILRKTAKNGLTLAVGKKDWRCSFVFDNDRCRP